MADILHGSARTTPRVRAELQASKETTFSVSRAVTLLQPMELALLKLERLGEEILRRNMLWFHHLPGRQLVTLEDAVKYIQKLPKGGQQLAEWQTAVEAMLLVVKYNGPTMMARIGALNRHVERMFNPDGKDTYWGRRKLKRDQ